MKKNILYLFFSGIAFTMFSCAGNAESNSINKDSVKTAMHTMNTDTSKFKLSMVDNKKDFVCKMPLTAGIGDTVHYKGKIYGFCSKGCKESFLQDPESYLAENAKEKK